MANICEKSLREDIKIRNNKFGVRFSLLVFILVAVFFCLPILQNFDFWGIEDWDEYLFRNALARKTILDYRQFPLWNPYTNGGNAFLAHPTSSFLSPFFVFVLIFGEVYGLKLAVIIHLIIGMLGMFLLTRHLGLSRFSAYFSSFVYMLGAIYPLHMAAGLVGEMTMAFLPYLFLCYLESQKNSRYILGAIFFSGLMFLGGSLRVVNISILFLFVYSIFRLLQKKSFRPLKMLFLIVVGAFLLCAVKTIPMSEFLLNYPRKIDITKGIFLSEILVAFLARVKTYDPEWLVSSYDWYHSGAYIGIIPLLLSIIGIRYNFKSRWPLISSGLIFLLIAIGERFPINLWKLLHSFPIYNMLHTPSRFILGILFCLSIMSGYGLRKIEGLFSNKPFLFRLIVPAIVIFILIDLTVVNSSILKDAFIIEPKKIESNLFFSQGLTNLDYLHQDSDVYPRFLSNKGTINAEEVDNIYPTERNILPSSSPSYRGEAYLLNNSGKVNIVSFSPNRIVVDVHSFKKDILLLNQNYYKGWRIKDENYKHNLKSFEGLISASVSPGHRTITFYYLPTSFVIGSIVSGLAVSVSLLAGIFWRLKLGK